MLLLSSVSSLAVATCYHIIIIIIIITMNYAFFKTFVGCYLMNFSHPISGVNKICFYSSCCSLNWATSQNYNTAWRIRNYHNKEQRIWGLVWYFPAVYVYVYIYLIPEHPIRSSVLMTCFVFQVECHGIRKQNYFVSHVERHSSWRNTLWFT